MIDLAAFAERGVPVANTGSTNATSVAEWCIGATMNLLRSYRWSDAQVRGGRWPNLAILDEAEPRELSGSRVGLVGAGAVGQALARMYRGFDCDVSYWSPRSRIDGARLRELPDLMRTCEIIVVAIARAPQTLGLIGADLLSSMPRRSILVDVSRGGIVDHRHVLELLKSEHLSGAAIDVYATEPPVLPGSVIGNEHILLSPHVAGVTTDAMTRTFEGVAANIEAICDGRSPSFVVNGVRATE